MKTFLMLSFLFCDDFVVYLLDFFLHGMPRLTHPEDLDHLFLKYVLASILFILPLTLIVNQVTKYTRIIYDLIKANLRPL